MHPWPIQSKYCKWLVEHEPPHVVLVLLLGQLRATSTPCALLGATLGVRRQQCAHLIRVSSLHVPLLLRAQEVAGLHERSPLARCNHFCFTSRVTSHLSTHDHPLLRVDEPVSRLRDLREHGHRRHVALEAVVRGPLRHLERAHLTPLRATPCSPSELRTGRARCAPMIASAERRRSPRALTKNCYETNTSRFQASLHENPFEYNKSHQQIGNQ